MKASAYLHFKDNAKEAIEMFKSIFKADVISEIKYEEGITDNPSLFGKIFHAELKIGDLNLYLCDTDNDETYHSIKFVIEMSDQNLAHAQFSKLTKHGKILQDFTKMPFGPIIGEVEDMFGITWNIVIC